MAGINNKDRQLVQGQAKTVSGHLTELSPWLCCLLSFSLTFIDFAHYVMPLKFKFVFFCAAVKNASNVFHHTPSFNSCIFVHVIFLYIKIAFFVNVYISIMTTLRLILAR